MKKLLCCFLLAFGFASPLHAQNFIVADIIVDGYQRISPGIIYNLLPVGIGDEVITTSNTAVPTVTAIVNAGAAVKFVDIDKDTLNFCLKDFLRKQIINPTRSNNYCEALIISIKSFPHFLSNLC